MNTRRELIRATVTVGIGMLATPRVLAREPELRMVARIFFDSYNTLALRQALGYAGDDGFDRRLTFADQKSGAGPATSNQP